MQHPPFITELMAAIIPNVAVLQNQPRFVFLSVPEVDHKYGLYYVFRRSTDEVMVFLGWQPDKPYRLIVYKRAFGQRLDMIVRALGLSVKCRTDKLRMPIMEDMIAAYASRNIELVFSDDVKKFDEVSKDWPESY